MEFEDLDDIEEGTTFPLDWVRLRRLQEDQDLIHDAINIYLEQILGGLPQIEEQEVD